MIAYLKAAAEMVCALGALTLFILQLGLWAGIATGHLP